MESKATGSPGDCQAAAADSRKAITKTRRTKNSLRASRQQWETTEVSTNTSEITKTRGAPPCAPSMNTTTGATCARNINTTTTTTEQTAAAAAATSPPTAEIHASNNSSSSNNNNNNTNNNNNNKLKSQHQQQQQQQNATPVATIKLHQFRAPHMLTRKNKTWNKRQNKCHLHRQQQQQQQQQQQKNAASVGTSGGSAGGTAGGGNGGHGTHSVTKADLENTQNVKNQHHHNHQYQQNHQYYNHHQQQGHHGGGGRGGGGGGGGNPSNGMAPCLCNLEKLGYGHGHSKQQLYKKMLAYRGHYQQHVLRSGGSHNGGGGGGSGGGGGGGTKSVCCLANGCAVPNNKESSNLSSHSNSSHPIPPYCGSRSKFFLPEKRLRKGVIIPPTKFLLGGTISDPLNLNSLQNESASNASSNNNTPATTPRQSPITTPPKVEVIIPPNIHDPLHLLDPVDSMEYEKQLTSPMKRRQKRAKTNSKKHRYRKNRKPKRRRHESYNSSVLEEDGDASSSVLANSSSLGNSTLSTEAVSVNASATTMSMPPLSAESVSGGGVACSSAIDDEETTEERKTTGDVELLYSSSGAERLERNGTTTTLSPRSGQQHVAASEGEVVVASVVERGPIVLRLRRSSERERVSKDLRLELNVCGGVSGASNNNNGSHKNSNNVSASSSTCGSSLVGVGSGGLGGGRKRKISESSNSQKNKKYHRLDSMDKIVSPVVPQPGQWKRPPRLVPTGARKAARRSTSVSENELLSPADEIAKTINDSEVHRVDTPENLGKAESISEAAGPGSPLSSASGATSVATGEHESPADVGVGEAGTSLTTTVPLEVDVAPAKVAGAPATNTGTASHLVQMPKFRPDGARYRYGNYVRYAGYRYLNEFMDVRLQVFRRHEELFKDKDILDIGCNVGHMTITVARTMSPKSILGIDIDSDLIRRARYNLSMYVRIPQPELKGKEGQMEGEELKQGEREQQQTQKPKTRSRHRRGKRKNQQQQQQHQHHNVHHHHHLLHHRDRDLDAAEFFPVSFPINFGCMPDDLPTNARPMTPSCIPEASESEPATKAVDFPKNVFFRHSNYVLKDESQLNNDSQQYDLIMCLSVTKWIHLNFGDSGLKLAFKRMFNQLRPGGKLILEAQNWASYKKKKNLTETIYNHYRNIEFFPNKFHEYLLSSEVGFSHSYTLDVPRHLNKGFCRPIQLYAKGDYTPNHARWSDAYYPQTPYEAYRGIYATMPPRPRPSISSSRSQNYDTPHHPGLGPGYGGGGAPGSSSSYSSRNTPQTPMYQPTSQYYNPLETDSYLPSYDMDYLNHLYVFASPLYQTIWSPPASLRNSSSHTPLYGSVREAELDGDASNGGGGGGGGGGGSGSDSYHRHVYPPNDDTSSPNANAGGAFNSIRDPDTDDSNQLPASSVQHVYATHCESSLSPHVLHAHESSEHNIDETLILSDVVDEVGSSISGANHCCSDSNEA